ncbi:hypothetical protein JZ751_027967 [Albula glossodonta]|uniref:DEP domain-containing protein n=1 Tax=Albula glossodonta TaxID=121402 RepID=A0A8T2PIR4_9TELE|nr:hypothetical protein JZ751_027967 [Albula glossodonta]
MKTSSTTGPGLTIHALEAEGSPMDGAEKSQMGRVTIYSVMGCPHCLQAKSCLQELGLQVHEVDINQHTELWVRVKELTGRSTVPQIFFNSVHIGGNDDLNKLAPEELERLVHQVREEPVPSDSPPLPEESHVEAPGKQDGEFKCERDDWADMVEEFKQCGVIGSHRKGLRVFRNSFTGAQLVNWLEKEKGLDRSKAFETGKVLMDRKFFNSVMGKREFEESSALFRMLEHDPHSALNVREMATCSPLEAAELSETLRNMMLRLYSEHLSVDGKSVDYKAMSQSPSFEHYCELAVQLQRVELQALRREEKLAFFINIYNALVIHGNLRLGAPKNMWQRYRVALPEVEPLIHFALNCGAKGCPPIKTYTAEDIDRQLRMAAEAFLENDEGCRVDAVKGEVKLSQIFKWYKGDFGDTDEEMLNWILNHMSDSSKKSSLQTVMKGGSFKVSFMPYDWSSNSKD